MFWAGSRVNISASAVDTHFLPMEEDYELETDAGEMDGNVLITPKEGGTVTVTASCNGKSGTTTVYAVSDPDNIAIRDSSSNLITTLSVAPGSTTQLTASAVYQHLSLKADTDAFTWSVTGDIGTIDENGLFTATTPGTGTIVASAGGKSAVIQVTVSKMALDTVEDFEEESTILTDGAGTNMTYSRVTGGDFVRYGKSAAKLDYTLTEELAASPSGEPGARLRHLRAVYQPEPVGLWATVPATCCPSCMVTTPRAASPCPSRPWTSPAGSR